jgi:hypothetical protein
MTNGSELKNASAVALREAGYVPLPRWWVTRADLDVIAQMAQAHAEDVNRIRAQANHAGPRPLTKEQEIELAWAKIPTPTR